MQIQQVQHFLNYIKDLKVHIALTVLITPYTTVDQTYYLIRQTVFNIHLQPSSYIPNLSYIERIK